MTQPLSQTEELLLFVDSAGYGNWVMISDKLLEFFPLSDENDYQATIKDSRDALHFLDPIITQDKLLSYDGSRDAYLGSSSSGKVKTLKDAKIKVRLTPAGRDFVIQIKMRLEEKKTTIKIGDGFTGAVIAGGVSGKFNQQILREDLPASNPIHHPTNAPSHPHKNIIKKIWGWVMNNPMSASIIGGIIALVIGTLILKLLHIL